MHAQHKTGAPKTDRITGLEKVSSKKAIENPLSRKMDASKKEQLSVKNLEEQSEKEPRLIHACAMAFSLSGWISVPTDPEWSWMSESFKKIPGGHKEPLDAAKPNLIRLNDFKLEYLEEFHKINKLKLFTILGTGPKRFPITIKTDQPTGKTSKLRTIFVKEKDSLTHTKSYKSEVRLTTGFYLKSIEEGKNKLAGILLRIAPEEISEDLEHLPLKTSLYSESAILSLLEALSPTFFEERYLSTTTSAYERDKAFQTAVTHYFHHPSNKHVINAKSTSLFKMKAPCVIHDTALQHSQIFLDDLSSLLNHVIKMRDPEDSAPNSEDKEKARLAGWQAATLLGNAINYIQETAKRVESSQSRAFKSIREAAPIIQAATKISTQRESYSGITGDLSDLDQHLERKISIKSLGAEDSSTFISLIRDLTAASDMIKYRAHEGFIAPGFKFLGPLTRQDFENEMSDLHLSYTRMGQEFLHAYSQQLKLFQ